MNSIIRTLPNKTSTDLSAKAGYCVEYDTSGMDVADAITDKVVGIIQRGGETASDVLVLGVGAAILGGTVTAGQHIQPHTDGSLVVSAGSSSQDIGVALESGVAGDWVQVLFLGCSNKY